MGLLKRIVDAQKPLSPAQNELWAVCGSLGNAIGKSVAGVMPPDFVTAVAEGSAPQFRAAFDAVSNEEGPDRAAAIARARIKDHAEIVVDVYGIPKRAVAGHVDGVLARMITGAPQS